MENAKIVVVDGDPVACERCQQVLGDSYQLSILENGQACLDWLEHDTPDLILMEVDLPDINGYELCQRIKQDLSNPPPVIFISDMHDEADRLRGYDAGGDDYVGKALASRELKAKVVSMLRFVESQRALKHQIDFASSAAMTAMTSMGEMGVLLEQLKRLHSCRTFQALAETVAHGFDSYGLNGVVMLRPGRETIMYASHGDPTPVEVRAIQHVAGMGRIIQFKSRMSISYAQVTLLFNNMPLEDPDRCGRLRDHLAILAEGVQMQVETLERNLVIQKNEMFQNMVQHLGGALQRIDSTQRERQMSINLAIQEMTDALERAYLSVALSENQERFMAGIVRSGAERILSLVSAHQDTQQELTQIIHNLTQANQNCAGAVAA